MKSRSDDANNLRVEIEGEENLIETEFKKKICLLGDGGVGKTSLIRRFVVDEFRDKYISTMGVKVMKKNVTLSNPVRVVTLMIWDVMGQEVFKPIFKRYFKGSDGVMLVCDITRHETFKHMEDWLKAMYDVTGTIPPLFLANKIDLIGEKDFPLEKLDDLADQHDSIAVKTSAETGKGVHDAFKRITEMMI